MKKKYDKEKVRAVYQHSNQTRTQSICFTTASSSRLSVQHWFSKDCNLRRRVSVCDRANGMNERTSEQYPPWKRLRRWEALLLFCVAGDAVMLLILNLYKAYQLEIDSETLPTFFFAGEKPLSNELCLDIDNSLVVSILQYFFMHFQQHKQQRPTYLLLFSVSLFLFLTSSFRFVINVIKIYQDTVTIVSCS